MSSNIEKIDHKQELNQDQKQDQKNNECQELKNIKYKTMLQNHSNISEKTESNIVNMDEILELEREKSKLLPWSKLEKCIKLEKLYDYADRYIEINNLTKQDNKCLKEFLKNKLEFRKIKGAKEITYDKNTGIIKTMPLLQYNNATKKFTLKNIEERKTLTTKGLAPKNKTKKRAGDKKGSRKNVADKMDK